MAIEYYSAYPSKLCFDFTAGDLLLVNSLQYLSTTLNRRLGKALTFTQLSQRFGTFKFLLVLLECLVDVFAVFRIND